MQNLSMNMARSVEFAPSPNVAAIERPRLCASGHTAIMSFVLDAAMTINDCIEERCSVRATPVHWFIHVRFCRNMIEKIYRRSRIRGYRSSSTSRTWQRQCAAIVACCRGRLGSICQALMRSLKLPTVDMSSRNPATSLWFVLWTNEALLNQNKINKYLLWVWRYQMLTGIIRRFILQPDWRMMSLGHNPPKIILNSQNNPPPKFEDYLFRPVGSEFRAGAEMV